MKVAAIIAEYNPFHSGHKYHIEKARELTGADIILVIMSGNFVQRGEPSILDKHFRAKAAVLSGADMVMELPYPYSCSSAEFFAESAVTYLHKLNCVDSLCFGSECDDIDALNHIARLLVNEPENYKAALKEHLKAGFSYPTARHNAVMGILKDEKYNHILKSPNNILGIEYMKALMKLNSPIKPVSIKRIISSYHHVHNNNPYFSASSIRDAYTNNTLDFSELEDICPLYGSNPLYPVSVNDFSNILSFKLQENIHRLKEYYDISADLSNRILNNLDKYTGFKSFIDILKTKNINYTSISRGLCHIMLGTFAEDVYNYRSLGYGDYVRILSFNRNAVPLFKMISTNSSMRIITKLSEADSILSELPPFNKELFNKSLFSDNIYRLVVQNKYKIVLPNEYRHRL